MFNSLLSAKTTYTYAVLSVVFAGLTIILAAVYILNMIRKVFYGNLNSDIIASEDIKWNEKFALSIIVLMIFWLGVYPQTLLNITNEISDFIANKIETLHFLSGQ